MSLKHFISILLLASVLIGCSSISYNEWTSLSINQGQHKCNERGIAPWESHELNFEFKFDSSAVYNLNSKNQLDVNKLIGLTENIYNPRKNSIRLGWRYRTDHKKVELLAYSHNNYKFQFEPICFIEIGKTYHGKIKINDKYLIQIDQIKKELKRSSSKIKKTGLLFFYFGGNEKAPHPVKIHLKLEK